MSEIKAQLNNLRLAPRKVRAVSDLIKGKNVIDALAQLEVMVKRSSLPVAKLLKSAIANAENNADMLKENLYVKNVKVNEGVKLRKFKPKGFGRVSPIEKKTSYIELTLAEKVPGMKRTARQIKKTEEAGSVEEKQAQHQEQRKPEIKTEIGKRSSVFGNIGKRVFRRKVI